MTIQLEISFQNFSPSPAIEADVRRNAERLERFHDRIVSCRVSLEQVNRHQHKGRMYEVRVDIAVPGGEIIANRNPRQSHAHEDIHVAIRDAFNAARRRLQDYVRRMSSHRATDRRGADHHAAPASQAHGKAHHVRHRGSVARLFGEDGYGFIAASDDREVYFHRNNVVAGGWEKLDIGTEVHFTEEVGDKGLHAHEVTPID